MQAVADTATDDAGTGASSGTSRIVVLQLEVLLDQQQDTLLLQPHAQDFMDGLTSWLRGLAALARSVPQLMQHLHLQVGFVVLVIPHSARKVAHVVMPAIICCLGLHETDKQLCSLYFGSYQLVLRLIPLKKGVCLVLLSCSPS